MAVLTEEHVMLKDAARAWVDAHAPVTAYRAMRDSGSLMGHDPVLWREMSEMGWPSILIPEEFGGLGFGFLGMGIVLEQLGRTLMASPLLGSAVSAPTAFMLAGTREQKERFLPALASGELIGALGIDEGPHHDPRQVAVRARPEGSGWVLSGDKRDVIGGMAAGVFVISARTAGEHDSREGISLFVVDAKADGLERSAIPQIDRRGAAALRLEEVRVGSDAVIGAVHGGAEILDSVLDRARAGLAMEMLGTATRAFEITVDHLKTRVQFGKTLGSFQALQHRAADLVGELELTRSAAEAAVAAIDADAPPGEIAELASLAKILAAETLKRVVNEMVQLHGGIGMTDEHDAGLYLKRSRAASVAYGDPAFHRERFANLAGY